ncbi:hypothetical protein [Moritella sp. 28]|uniref:hypothetical protein n=1 Tax=Moritella sp. 28 TaxID=2746232 RepID=UPI001BA48914|nr:hypothetical protein [Moritella sp. 28]QUM86392.1 hypothetical protein HWV02_18710 [Moritella sp. 28]
MLSSYDYGFDIAGNLTSLQSSKAENYQITPMQASYNALNQIVSYNGATDAFRYDALGET